MNPISVIDDLYRYNSWANERIFALCADLSDAQLDEPRELGLGSLRNTLFHMLAAEEVWFERWTNVPWRPFPLTADGLSLGEIRRRLDRVAIERAAFMERERSALASRICQYKDGKGNTWANRLDGLLLHVANHAIHHRAQALNYLKRFGKTVPGGLDFLFFRIAQPHVRQEPETIQSMREFGLEVETGASPPLTWEHTRIGNYFAYGDWANARLLKLCEPLDDGALDRSWDMGLSSIRKTVLHIADAERWWLKNLTVAPTQFERAPTTTSMVELHDQWNAIVAKRGRFIDALDESGAQQVVTALVGPMSVRVQVIEALVQLCGHGTHHRAQLINMLRHSQVTAPGCDYSIWQREMERTGQPLA